MGDGQLGAWYAAMLGVQHLNTGAGDGEDDAGPCPPTYDDLLACL